MWARDVSHLITVRQHYVYWRQPEAQPLPCSASWFSHICVFEYLSPVRRVKGRYMSLIRFCNVVVYRSTRISLCLVY